MGSSPPMQQWHSPTSEPPLWDSLDGATVVDLDAVVTLAFSVGATFLTGLHEKFSDGGVGPSTHGPIAINFGQMRKWPNQACGHGRPKAPKGGGARRVPFASL